MPFDMWFFNFFPLEVEHISLLFDSGFSHMTRFGQNNVLEKDSYTVLSSGLNRYWMFLFAALCFLPSLWEDPALEGWKSHGASEQDPSEETSQTHIWRSPANLKVHNWECMMALWVSQISCGLLHSIMMTTADSDHHTFLKGKELFCVSG